MDHRNCERCGYMHFEIFKIIEIVKMSKSHVEDSFEIVFGHELIQFRLLLQCNVILLKYRIELYLIHFVDHEVSIVSILKYLE